MKRKLRLLFPVVAACFALSGCDFISIKGKGEVKITDPYYADLNYKGKSGTKLQQELQKFLFAKHKHYVAYGEVNTYFKKTADRNSAEAAEDGSDNNEWFYTGKVRSGTGDREHVWPCAKSDQLWVHKEDAGLHYVDNPKYVGGGSDLYHIRTCTGSVNQNRGSSRFVQFSDTEMKDKTGVKEIGDGGPYKLKVQGTDSDGFANFSEPDDHMKGDVARIILYLYVHYNYKNIDFDGGFKSGSTTYKFNDMLGDLVLTNIMGYDTAKRCQEELKEWNEMDPPSEVEKLRNNTVQKVQGNRNPFVDYPELVDILF